MQPLIREMPEGFAQMGNQTLIHPVGLAATIILGLLLLFLPRKWAIIPFLGLACFIPSAQRVVIFELDFALLRILVIFAVLRILIRKEYVGFKLIGLDKVFLAWMVSSMLIFSLRVGTFSAVVNRLGFGFDALGFYFTFRALIRDWQDVSTVIFGVILLSIPVMICFLIEHRTGRNFFSIFGGVPEITPIREDRLRCQGAYAHPILAGCFWAALLPLIMAFFWHPQKSKLWAFVGSINALLIVYFSSSSTPYMGALGAFIGACFFVFRKYMRLIRWGLAVMLFALHMVMKAPVWHLIARVSVVGGSTGYHRFLLIDRAIAHFPEWAILGTNSTAHWGWGLQDVTNQFILEGVTSGFSTLVLFVWLISLSFGYVGTIWRYWRRQKYFMILAWMMGVSVFVHCLNWIGVSYFGQIGIIWYLLLAMIGSTASCSFLLNPFSQRRAEHAFI